MTRAAERMGISVPSVSAQIRALEKECGAPLFKRLTRSLELTREGTTLFNAIHQFFAETSTALKQISQRQDFLTTMELGLQKGWHEFYVQEVLANLAGESLPQIELRSSPQEGAYRDFLRTAVIAPSDRVEKGKDQIRTLLYAEEYYFCGAKKFLKKHPSRTKSLALEMPFLLWGEEWAYGVRALEGLFSDGVRGLQVLRSDFPQFLLQMLHSQPCLSLLPLSVLKQQPQLERLTWGKPLRREIILLAARGSLQQSHAGALKEAISRQLKQVTLPLKDH